MAEEKINFISAIIGAVVIVLCPDHHSIAESLNVSVLRANAKHAYRIKTTIQKVD